MNQSELKNKVSVCEQVVFEALIPSSELICKHIAFQNAAKKGQRYYLAWSRRPANKEILKEISLHNKKVNDATEALEKAWKDLDTHFPTARSEDEKKEDVVSLMRRRMGDDVVIVDLNQM